MSTNCVNEVIQKYNAELIEDWIGNLRKLSLRSEAGETQLRRHCTQFLQALVKATANKGGENIEGPAWEDMRHVLEEIASERARQGSTPSETATFVFSLKQALFSRLRIELAKDVERLNEACWDVNLLIDKLGLFSIELFQRNREHIIARQQQELLELSTPVVKLWKNILALPLIGTLDSGRTQVVMENLLQKIIETGAAIAIIDITGVPTVDTLVAQHLLKTIAAARLMGADCIISGIRPQIAQTIVHLGVNLEDVITKATLADAFIIALERTGTKFSVEE